MDGTNALCISHGEDADGLVCAAFLRRMKNASTILATYDDFEGALREVKPPVEELYICDLNIREALVDEILRINKFARVTIIDHHASAEGLLESLVEKGVRVLHSVKDSASVILYDNFREELGREAGRLAAYAAWADQFEDGPIASRLLWDYDRQFVQHEALILTHAIVRTQEPEFWNLVVEWLSKLSFPHEIPGVLEAALAHLRESAGFIANLPKEARRLGRLAYLEATDDYPIGTVANLILDALRVDVGLCYRVKPGSNVNVSIRSRRGLTFHLGEITRRVASRHAGFGGGHKRASGASLPPSSLWGFIDDVVRELGE
jgi:hypothetical protein